MVIDAIDKFIERTAQHVLHLGDAEKIEELLNRFPQAHADKIIAAARRIVASAKGSR